MKHRTVRTLLHTCVRLTIGLGMLIALALSLVVPSAEAATRTFVGFDVTADGQGYLMMSSAGEFYAYGTARAWPNPTGFSGSMTSVAITADGQGALAMSSAGQFYAYGTARAWPNPDRSGQSSTMTSVAITADGQGAVATSSAGQFYAYGTVPPRSNPTGFTGPMIAVALTRDGQGMASLSGSGQVYAYGTVVWRGNGDPGTTAPARADLASQILGNGRITLWEKHDSGRVDDATAKRNIQDTKDPAKKYLAARSSYGTAPGGTVALDDRMLRGMLALANSYTFQVSDIAGGSHSTGSRHYAGVAFDVPFINGKAVNINDRAARPTYDAFMQRCRDLGATEVLGPGNKDHDTHIHCAWPRP